MNESNEFIIVQKAGRCANGFQLDHGIVTHAYPANKYHYGAMGKALCGTKPGRRSVGFVESNSKQITCKQCLNKLKRLTDV